MNVKTSRKLLLVANTLLTLGILSYVGLAFVLGDAMNRESRTADEILPKLPPAPAGRVGAQGTLPLLEYRYLHELPISGDLPVVEKKPDVKEEVTEVPPLARNYELSWVKVDQSNPWLSFAHLRDKRKAETDPKRIVNLERGEVIDGWKLVAVSVDSAEFQKVGGDETVTLEVSRAPTPTLGSAPVEDGGSSDSLIVRPGRGEPPPRAAPRKEAIETSENVWEVPVEEEAWWEAYGEEAAASDVSLEAVRDPDTGRPMGMMIKSLKGNSILARRGLAQGDVIRSINGTPASSRADITAYVKGPGKNLPRYVVEVERNGKVFTITYNVKR